MPENRRLGQIYASVKEEDWKASFYLKFWTSIC